MNNNDLLVIKIDEQTISISELRHKEDTKEKLITMTMDNNFMFEASILNKNIEDTTGISFLYQKDDFLYPYLLKLLNQDDDLIITDEGTNNNNTKTLSIMKYDNYIRLVFTNLTGQINNIYDRFYIFVENSNKNKELNLRLNEFFNDIKTEIMNNENNKQLAKTL